MSSAVTVTDGKQNRAIYRSRTHKNGRTFLGKNATILVGILHDARLIVYQVFSALQSIKKP